MFRGKVDERRNSMRGVCESCGKGVNRVNLESPYCSRCQQTMAGRADPHQEDDAPTRNPRTRLCLVCGFRLNHYNPTQFCGPCRENNPEVFSLGLAMAHFLYVFSRRRAKRGRQIAREAMDQVKLLRKEAR